MSLWKVWAALRNPNGILVNSSKDEVEKLLKWSFAFTTVPMEQGKRKLSETVLVYGTDVRVFLERLLW